MIDILPIRILVCLLSGLSLGAAWIYTGTVTASILGFFACFLIIIQVWISDRNYLTCFFTGFISHLLAFYWLINTFITFGGMPWVLAFLLYLLFCIVSSFQFLTFNFIYKNSPRIFENLNLRVAFAWLVAEILPFKIFPWHLGHTQLAFTNFSLSARFASSLFISLMMFFLLESLLKYFFLRQKKVRLALAPLIFITLIFINIQYKNNFYQTKDSLKSLHSTIIQANISTEKKSNFTHFAQNLEDYQKLTNREIRKNTLNTEHTFNNLQTNSTATHNSNHNNKTNFHLYIWPESVVTQVISLNKAKELFNNFLPLYKNSALIFGGITTDSFEKFNANLHPNAQSASISNSALTLTSKGLNLPVYKKRILMPFGEYTPGATIFPFLAKLNPTVTNFEAGTTAAISDLKFTKTGQLICYEDVVPFLAREATLNGAEVLINLTNDAWFGNTVAPFQHNTIASFRAIENSRYLIRSTNSGLTAIINPLGEIEAKLPVFSEGVLRAKVPLLSSFTTYTLMGNTPWWALSIITILCALLIKIKRFKRLRKLSKTR